MNFYGFAVQDDLAAVGGDITKDAVHNLRASRAHQAGNAQHLARFHGEGDVLKQAVFGQMLDFQHRVADVAVPGRIALADVPANHHADNVIDIRLSDGLRCNEAAVAQDGDTVAELKNLFQPVGDIDNGDALAPQIPRHPEQNLRLLGGQRGGGLIHNDDLCVPHQRLGNLNHLLLSHGELIHGGIHGNADTQLAQRVLTPLPHGLSVQQPAVFFQLLAHEHILFHGQIKHDIELLINEHNALCCRLTGMVIVHLPAIHPDDASVPFIDTGQNLHQRGFTCTVLP